jgi:hypothetical protein
MVLIIPNFGNEVLLPKNYIIFAKTKTKNIYNKYYWKNYYSLIWIGLLWK